MNIKCVFSLTNNSFSNIKYWDLRKVSLEKPKSLTAKTKIKKPCTNSSFTLNNFSYLETKIRKMNEEAESLKMNISNIDYTYFVYDNLKNSLAKIIFL